MQTSKLIGHRYDRFIQPVLKVFEPLPFSFGLRLIPDRQALQGGIQSQPDIASAVAPANAEGLVKESHPASFRDPTDGRDLPGAERQRSRHGGHTVSRQIPNPIPVPQPGGRVGLARGDVVRAVPLQEGSLSPWDVTTAGEVMAIPELRGPQVIEGFYRPVVVRFAQRGQQDVDAKVQAQPHDRADDLRLAPPAECTFIVELGQVWHPQGLPGVEQVLAGGGSGFGGLGRRAGIVAIDVDRVEGLHYLAAGDPASDDIGNLHGVGIRSWRMGPIGVTRGPGSLGRQLVAAQDALNRAQTGRGAIVGAPLVLDGAGPYRGKPQARLSALDQLLAQAGNTPLTPGRECVGLMMGRARSRAKARPGMLRAIPRPLVHPTAAAMKFLCHALGRDSCSVHLYRRATQLRLSLVPSCGAHNSPPDWR